MQGFAGVLIELSRLKTEGMNDRLKSQYVADSRSERDGNFFGTQNAKNLEWSGGDQRI